MIFTPVRFVYVNVDISEACSHMPSGAGQRNVKSVRQRVSLFDRKGWSCARPVSLRATRIWQKGVEPRTLQRDPTGFGNCERVEKEFLELL